MHAHFKTLSKIIRAYYKFYIMFIELNYFYMTNKGDSAIYLVHSMHEEKKELQ